MDEIKAKIESALDELRPYLKADGGDIAVVDISDDLVVQLEFLGACGTCNMSVSTFKAGVVEVVKKAVPQISSIEVINLTE